MTLSDVCTAAQHRLVRPGAWGAVVLLGLLWNGLRWLTGPETLALGEALVPFVFGGWVLLAAALPWEWTGDARPLASFGRGLLQALPWNALMVVLLALLLPEHGGGRGGRGSALPEWLPPMPPRLMMLLVACGVFGLLAGWMVAERDREASRAELHARTVADQARLLRETQARALQAQMNPHVLFNTLSGLAELAREDGPATEQALVDLASLLRRLLHHSSQVAVPLSEECSLVEALLALERFRIGDRMTVHWRWDEDLEAIPVPPLLLQPLVENAVKHGIAPARGGGMLEIVLTGTVERVVLQVSNTGLPLQACWSEGTGLANLRQRLSLMTEWTGRLELRAEPERTLAELVLERVHG